MGNEANSNEILNKGKIKGSTTTAIAIATASIDVDVFISSIFDSLCVWCARLHLMHQTPTTSKLTRAKRTGKKDEKKLAKT